MCPILDVPAVVYRYSPLQPGIPWYENAVFVTYCITVQILCVSGCGSKRKY
jgi:hypothetical protein